MRIKKEDSSGTTVYVGKWYEKNLTTGKETFYYYLGSRLVAFKHDGDLRYVFQDHLGSTALVTDVNGDLVYEASYDPWGNVHTSTGTLDMDRTFTGQRFDSATGLYYYNARYYDPTIGRFISPDSIVPNVEYPPAWNRYAYVLNNPLRHIDPSGHVCQSVWFFDEICWTGTVQLGGYVSASALVSGKVGAGVAFSVREHGVEAGLYGDATFGVGAALGISAGGDVTATNARTLSDVAGAFVETEYNLGFGPSFTAGTVESEDSAVGGFTAALGKGVGVGIATVRGGRAGVLGLGCMGSCNSRTDQQLEQPGPRIPEVSPPSSPIPSPREFIPFWEDRGKVRPWERYDDWDSWEEWLNS